MRFFAALTTLLAVTTLGACTNPRSGKSNLRFGVADKNAKNVALVVGSPNDLRGVARDVVNVSKMLRDSNLGYEVVVLNDATKSDVLSKAASIAEGLTKDSTVFFYFSGHGSQSGQLIGQGHTSFYLRDVATKIGSKNKIKRFIAVMDACFSGQNVDGANAMFLTKSNVALTEREFLDAVVAAPNTGLFYKSIQQKIRTQGESSSSAPEVGSLPFEQSLVVAAAQKTQTSLDAGPSVGGIFTASWLQAIGSNQAATVGRILEDARSKTVANAGNGHEPVWRVMPDSLLQETFSGSVTSSGPIQNPDNGSQAPSNGDSVGSPGPNPSPNPGPSSTPESSDSAQPPSDQNSGPSTSASCQMTNKNGQYFCGVYGPFADSSLDGFTCGDKGVNDLCMRSGNSGSGGAQQPSQPADQQSSSCKAEQRDGKYFCGKFGPFNDSSLMGFTCGDNGVNDLCKR